MLRRGPFLLSFLLLFEFIWPTHVSADAITSLIDKQIVLRKLRDTQSTGDAEIFVDSYFGTSALKFASFLKRLSPREWASLPAVAKAALRQGPRLGLVSTPTIAMRLQAARSVDEVDDELKHSLGSPAARAEFLLKVPLSEIAKMSPAALYALLDYQSPRGNFLIPQWMRRPNSAEILKIRSRLLEPTPSGDDTLERIQLTESTRNLTLPGNHRSELIYSVRQALKHTLLSESLVLSGLAAFELATGMKAMHFFGLPPIVSTGISLYGFFLSKVALSHGQLFRTEDALMDSAAALRSLREKSIPLNEPLTKFIEANFRAASDRIGNRISFMETGLQSRILNVGEALDEYLASLKEFSPEGVLAVDAMLNLLENSAEVSLRDLAWYRDQGKYPPGANDILAHRLKKKTDAARKTGDLGMSLSQKTGFACPEILASLKDLEDAPQNKAKAP